MGSISDALISRILLIFQTLSKNSQCKLKIPRINNTFSQAKISQPWEVQFIRLSCYLAAVLLGSR